MVSFAERALTAVLLVGCGSLLFVLKIGNNHESNNTEHLLLRRKLQSVMSPQTATNAADLFTNSASNAVYSHSDPHRYAQTSTSSAATSSSTGSSPGFGDMSSTSSTMVQQQQQQQTPDMPVMVQQGAYGNAVPASAMQNANSGILEITATSSSGSRNSALSTPSTGVYDQSPQTNAAVSSYGQTPGSNVVDPLTSASTAMISTNGQSFGQASSSGYGQPMESSMTMSQQTSGFSTPQGGSGYTHQAVLSDSTSTLQQPQQQPTTVTTAGSGFDTEQGGSGYVVPQTTSFLPQSGTEVSSTGYGTQSFSYSEQPQQLAFSSSSASTILSADTETEGATSQGASKFIKYDKNGQIAFNSGGMGSPLKESDEGPTGTITVDTMPAVSSLSQTGASTMVSSTDTVATTTTTTTTPESNKFIKLDENGQISFKSGGMGSPLKESNEGPTGTITAVDMSIAKTVEDNSGVTISGGGVSFNSNAPQPQQQQQQILLQQQEIPAANVQYNSDGQLSFKSGGIGSPLKESDEGPSGTTTVEAVSLTKTTESDGIAIGAHGSSFDSNAQQQQQQEEFPLANEATTMTTGTQTGLSQSGTGTTTTSSSTYSDSMEYPTKVEPYPAGGPDAALPQTTSASTTLLSTSSTVASTTMMDTASQSDASQQQFQMDAAECEVKKPQEVKVPATWLSAYPGSGSKLAWQLIQAITGIYTGDDYDSTGQASKGVVVAVKTHYPSHSEQRAFQNEIFSGINRAIFLIRNPLHAIPAFFRFIYYDIEKNERKDELDVPPVGRWVFWRNANFEVELKAWVAHTKYWLTHFTPENLYLLPFENLISSELGSKLLQEMGDFLGKGDQAIASQLISQEQYCCVWEKVVKHSNIDGQQLQKRKDAGHSVIFTLEQLEAMIQALIRVRDSSKSNFPAFYQLMEEYIGEIVAAKKQVLALTKHT